MINPTKHLGEVEDIYLTVGERPDYPYVPEPFETIGGATDGIYCFLVYGFAPRRVQIADGKTYIAVYTLTLWGDGRLRYLREDAR